MGVIRNFGALPGPLFQPVENAIDEIIGDAGQAVPPPLPAGDAPVFERAPRQRKVRQRNSTRVEVVGLSSRGSHRSGSKKCRRLQNAYYLQSLAEAEEVAEVSIYDFVQESVSAFARLLSERENVQVWNDFVNCTEEEQHRIVDRACHGENGDESADSGAEEFDARTGHPAFSAKESFRRLDGDLRTMLRKRHVPLGKLSKLEEEVSSFFKSHPESEYRNRLCNSFERLMLHALCQYMDLISRSYDSEGIRWTRVWNRRPVFVPPAVSLSSYLQCRCGDRC